MRRYNALQKALALTLTLVMVLGIVLGTVPTTAKAASSDFVRVADTATYDAWKNYFPTQEGQLHTAEAGAVWTDKSVFTKETIPSTWTAVSSSFEDTGDNFLVALSALAANKIVKGYSNLPTDTMLVLDVSGSMNNSDDGNESADEMVKAANAAIDELLALNLNNRVGVVLYSGNHDFGNSTTGTAQVLLPLDRYTTTVKDNQNNAVYLNHTMPSGNRDETVSVNSAVRTGTGTTITGSKAVEGGTYIQNGIWQAAQQLINAQDKVIATGVQAGTVRMPIMVLMSDGAPTVATNAYTNPQTSNRGNGGSTSDAMGFLTQLTAAYAWAKIEEAYNTDGRFYTLGLGVTGNNVAEAVLDPTNETTTNISNYWRRYLALSDGATMDLNTNSNNSADSVSRQAIVTSRNYVTKYYEATGTNLGQSLLNAFDAIVDEIVLQSRYYPTLVDEGNPDVDGYVTFRDEIGMYMEVTDIKGIRLNGVLHTGELLARNFVTGGGDLGTMDDPTSLGDELVWAVQKRLGITDVNEARALLNAAYEYGQLSYTGPGQFSNYIGWFGDENDQFVDFWYEGMPEEQYPDDAYFINKSYSFLGDVDTAHGIAASDMMYTMVRVRERIKEDTTGTQKVGEVIVDWSIPATLVPTITYVVELNGDTYDSGVKGLSVEAWKDADDNTVAYAPMRLMYEVALRSDINELNIVEKTGGQTTFYTNAWNGTETDTSVNTFSHFEPSTANERFYFTENKTILVKNGDNYVPYTGSEPAWAEDTYYHAHTYFDADATATQGVVTEYEPLTQTTFGHKQQSTDGAWYIPSGTIHRYYHDVYDAKTEEENKTSTLGYSLYPHIKHQEASGSTAGHYYVTSTLGNNGKLTVTPATGILLSKKLAEDAAATDKSFTFKITGGSGSEGSYTVTPLNDDGSYGTAYTVTVEDGEATVTLKPGETVYVTGMTGGTTYTVTEQSDAEYSVESVLVGDNTATNPATITPTAQTITPVVFTNAEKGEGGLFITKEVTSDTSFPSATFDLTVTLEGNSSTDFKIYETNMAYTGAEGEQEVLEVTNYNYDAATGVISNLQIVHGQTIQISGLSEGTKATVTETLTKEQKTAGFSENIGYSSINFSGDPNGDNDGVVTIHKDRNATVVVKNTYTADPVDVTINFDGTKNFDAEKMTEDSTFTFKLQKYEGDQWVDVTDKTAEVTVKANTKDAVQTFNIPDLVLEDLTVGTTSYQIVEVKGKNIDVTYDRSVYTFSVVVTDNGNGALVANVVGHNTGTNFSVTEPTATTPWTVNTIFNNEYHTTATAIDIVKEVEDNANAGKTGAGFVIESYKAAVDSEGKLIETEGVWTVGDLIRTTTTDAQGEARLVRNYDNTDFAENETTKTYHFIIKEKHAGTTVAGWTYDDAQYQVTVVLERTIENGATTSMSIKSFEIVKVKDGEEPTKIVVGTDYSAAITFTNTFDPVDAEITDLNVLPVVKKTLTGKTMTEDEFKFEIVNADGTAVVSTGYSTIESGKEGWVLFDKKLTFSEVGTYHYKIREVAGTNAGITYDPTVYDMVVEVTENDGVLSADYFFEDATTKTVTFENSYKAEPASIELEGTKTLTGGRQLLSGEFHFDLVEMTDNTFQNEKENGLKLSAANTGAQANNGNAVGNIQFESIPYDQVGTYYYKVIERAGSLTDLGVTYSTDVAHITVTVTDPGNGQLTAAATYTMKNAGGSAMNFVNTYQALPANTNFAVSKELEGKTLAGEDFTFALYEATVASGDWATEGNAIQTVTNRQDGTISFDEITYYSTGTHYYIVKEIPPEGVDSEGNKDGIHYDSTEYRITIEVTDNWKGKLEAETSIVDQDGVPYEVMVFHNTYTVSGEAGIELSGTKMLDVQSGALELKDDMFTFVITDEAGAEVSTTTNKGNQISFEKLTYGPDDCGKTYTYTIKEKPTDYVDVTISDAVYTLKVEVSDDKGKVIVDYTLTDQEENAVVNTALNFTNVYNAQPISHTIEALKEYNKELKGGEFTFELIGTINGTNVGHTVENAAGGKVTFKALTFDRAGVYTFKVKEVTKNQGYIAWSDAVYEVTIPVVNTKGDLSFGQIQTVKLSGENIKETDLKFINAYQILTTAKVTLEATKTYDKPLKGEDFKFTLEGEIDGTAVKQEKTNDKDGKIKFDTLTFTKEGTYTFEVKEKDELLGFITYSKAVYTVTVEVKDNGEGALIATVKVNDKADGKIAFENVYKMVDADNELTLSGTKTLTGRTLADKEFSFGLYDAEGKLIEKVTNAADGSFAFTKLTYQVKKDEVQNYTYTVKEIAGTDPCVTYDKTVYTVKVAVKDNGEGEAELTYTINDKADGKLAFANTYTAPKNVVAQVNVVKKLVDKANAGYGLDGFTFQLTNGEQKVTAESNKDGKASFQLTFTADEIGKTFEYKISEVKGKTAGMTYDKTVHTIKAKVEQNADGSLKLLINDKEADKVEVSFTNTYEKPANPVTGDNFPIFLLGALMLISVTGISVLLLSKRKKGGKYAK